MAKSKFVRIAVSGPTIDGRNIDPNQLIQAAANYNRDTYAARGNIEHVRGVSGDKPFGMYADILALKTEPVTLDVAGKQENRVGLFAELEVSDDLVALNKKGQKLYTSVELLPNFAQTNQAYCVGLAFTDSPASLGTERLQFTTNARALGNLVSAPDEFHFQPADLAPGTAQQSEAVSLIAGVKDLFSALTGAKPELEKKPDPVATQTAGQFDMAAFATTIQGGFTKLGEAIDKSAQANAAATQAVASDLAAFKAQLEKTPNANYTARPPASGGDGMLMAEC